MIYLLCSRLTVIILAGALIFAGCGGGGNATTSSLPAEQASTPVITSSAAQNGAKIVTLTTSTAGATIYYTVDGSAPTSSSQVYTAPFLVASDLTINAVATAPGETVSAIATQAFSLNIAPGTLVWADEFDNATGANAQPDSHVWAYDTGGGGWGNGELEVYCGWNDSVAPCSAANPNAYVGTDGYLHLVAQQPSSGVYTSARLKTQGLFSLQYGRVEVRAQVPEEQGLWPAFWLLGNNITKSPWPACGEMDVLERVNAVTNPDWNEGSVHGTGFTGTSLGTMYHFSNGQTAAGWHTYGMIWSKDKVSYYVDDPAAPYATYTPASLSGLSGAVWPFNAGANFILINLAVGGTWPGSPNSNTSFPAQLLVDYVRVYTS